MSEPFGLADQGQSGTLLVGLYHNPPDKAVVLCVDEKSQVQASTGRSRFCHDAGHA